MPHVSQKNLSKQTKRELENRVLAFLDSTSARSRYYIFQELFTETERLMIAKRLAMIAFIKYGVTTHDISATLGVSPSIVARYQVVHAKGRFRHTSSWVRTRHAMHALVRLAGDLMAIPFTSRRKSLARLADEQWAKPQPRRSRK